MTTNPFFSGRIPQSLYDAIEAHRQQSGESKTDVLVKALSAYVNHTVEPEPGFSCRLEAIESRMAEIEQILSEIQARGLAEPRLVQGDIFGANDDFFKNACNIGTIPRMGRRVSHEQATGTFSASA